MSSTQPQPQLTEQEERVMREYRQSAEAASVGERVAETLPIPSTPCRYERGSSELGADNPKASGLIFGLQPPTFAYDLLSGEQAKKEAAQREKEADLREKEADLREMIGIPSDLGDVSFEELLSMENDTPPTKARARSPSKSRSNSRSRSRSRSKGRSNSRSRSKGRSKGRSRRQSIPNSKYQNYLL